MVPADKLNPLKSAYNQEKYDRQRSKSGSGGDATERDSNKRLAVTLSSPDNSEVLSKWRRVGSVSGSAVRLDTIIWPGGDIVVSGECVSVVIYCSIARSQRCAITYQNVIFAFFLTVVYARFICTSTFGVSSCDSIVASICHAIGIG